MVQLTDPGSPDGIVMKRDRSGWLVRRDAAREAQWRMNGTWTGMTLADHARVAAERTPDRVLLIDGDVQVTAAVLYAEAERAAGAMMASGLNPGDVISLQLPNWIEACVINLAAAMAGLVVNPIIPIYRGAELVHILNDCRSRMIFVPAEFRKFDYRAMLREVCTQIENPPEVVVVRGSADELTSFEAFLARDDGNREFPETKGSDVMMVLYTSGTTGRAKGVLLTHDSGDVMVRDYDRCWGPWEGETLVVPSPITHITGAVQVLYLPVQCRATVVMMDAWDAERGLELLKRHKATFFGGAPPFLRDLLEIAKQQDEHLPSLRILACGGASVPPGLLRACHEQFTNARVFRAYGCSEVPAVTEGTQTLDQIDYGAETDGWIGATEVRLVRPGTDEPVGPDEEGEILAMGAQMLVGYSRPENNEAAFTTDGFFRTGDLGRIRDGYLTITGRFKDLIIRNGENLSPKEIEDALEDMPMIAEISVVGVDDERTGEAVCAVVVPRGAASPTVTDLGQHLSGKGLARQKWPDHVVLMKELPRNFGGKVQKEVLRQDVSRLLAKRGEAMVST